MREKESEKDFDKVITKYMRALDIKFSVVLE